MDFLWSWPGQLSHGRFFLLLKMKISNSIFLITISYRMQSHMSLLFCIAQNSSFQDCSSNQYTCILHFNPFFSNKLGQGWIQIFWVNYIFLNQTRLTFIVSKPTNIVLFWFYIEVRTKKIWPRNCHRWEPLSPGCQMLSSIKGCCT